MMWNDVVDLRDFYHAPQGAVARRMVRRAVRALWPDVSGQRVLGLGYATPYLGAFRSQAERVIAAMPAPQGVLHWPDDEPRLAALVDEYDLPFADLSMDRVLLVHALECVEQVRPFLREVWRVMADSGRLLIVVPNRRGLWAATERTPFGHGRPYSPSQLSGLLRENLLTPLVTRQALFVPPVRWRLVLSTATASERAGMALFGHFGGVVVMEAVKQIYAGTPIAAAEPVRGRRYFPAGAPKGAPRVGRGGRG